MWGTSAAGAALTVDVERIAVMIPLTAKRAAFAWTITKD